MPWADRANFNLAPGPGGCVGPTTSSSVLAIQSFETVRRPSETGPQGLGNGVRKPLKRPPRLGQRAFAYGANGGYRQGDGMT